MAQLRAVGERLPETKSYSISNYYAIMSRTEEMQQQLISNHVVCWLEANVEHL